MTLAAPSWLTAIGESLSPLEFTRLLAALPDLALQPRGKGEAVVVLPGYGASDTSTRPLRGYLSWLGYAAEGWNLGRNRGDVQNFVRAVSQKIQRQCETSGAPVHLIGWSLGGVIAREVARENPDQVHQVITMGSPLVGGPKYTTMGRLFERQGANLDELEARIAARESRPIRVPVTSIFSKRDGVVGWQASIDRHSPEADNIEVGATHLGLGISPDVYRIIARKLAKKKNSRR
jgi:alpha/beta superfamily hydrolase